MNLSTTVWIVLFVIKMLGVSTVVSLSWLSVFAAPVLVFFLQWIVLTVFYAMRSALVEYRMEKASRMNRATKRFIMR